MAGNRLSEVVYPYTDEYGYVWVDPSGFISTMHLLGFEDGKQFKSPCFICSRMTSRIDINFEGYFCNSYVCNLVVSMDLKGVKYVDAEGH